MSDIKLLYKPHLFLILVAVWLIPSLAEGQRLTEYITADSLNAGDIFEYSITLDRNESYDRIVFPDSSHFGELFEIRSRQQFRVTEYKDSLLLRLQFFGTKDTTLAALPVYLISENDTTELYTNPAPINFQTVLQSEEDEFRPFKPIFDFAATWWPYILVLLLLIAAGWYLYQKYFLPVQQTEPKTKPVFSPEPFRDPLNQLANNLRQLKSFSFSSEEDYEQFYIKLGDSIREYFEHLHQIPALESTSSEILRDLKRRALDKELIDHTRRVLNEADMVKFARFTPTEQQAEEALQKADAFLKKARRIDGPRVDQLRRQHNMKIEKERKAFEQQEDEESVE